MTYSAIADVSNVLIELIAATADERSPIDSSRVELASPADIDSRSSVDIALYPYHIETDAAMGSGSHPTSGTRRQDRPLALSIRYLVTAYAVGDGSGDDEGTTNPFKRQQRLGAVLQLFHDNSRIEPADAPGPLLQEQPLSISIVDESVDVRLSLWSQFADVTHHPSATIEVSPVIIQSLNEAEFTRVEEHETSVDRRSNTSN